jgi:ESS family glutamate:Na+ symporter
MIIGYLINEFITEMGLKLPLFVSCLVVGIILSNTLPKIIPGLPWPMRTKALALVSDFSLGLFISMSLMGMQLWSIAELAGPLLVILTIQTATTLIFILFILFKLIFTLTTVF